MLPIKPIPPGLPLNLLGHMAKPQQYSHANSGPETPKKSPNNGIGAELGGGIALAALNSERLLVKPNPTCGALSKEDQEALNEVMYEGIKKKSTPLIELALIKGANPHVKYSDAKNPEKKASFFDLVFKQIFTDDEPVISIENINFLIDVFKLALTYEITCSITYYFKAKLFGKIFDGSSFDESLKAAPASIELDNVLNKTLNRIGLNFEMGKNEIKHFKKLNQKEPKEFFFYRLFFIKLGFEEAKSDATNSLAIEHNIKNSLRFIMKVIGEEFTELTRLLKFIVYNPELMINSLPNKSLVNGIIRALKKVDNRGFFKILSSMSETDNKPNLLETIILLGDNHSNELGLETFKDYSGFSKTIEDVANSALRMNAEMTLRALDLKRFESEPGFNELIARLFFKALEMKSYDCLTYLLSQEFSYSVFKSLKSQLIATDSRLDVDMEKKTFELLIQQLRPDELDILPPWGGKGKTSLAHLSVHTDKLSDTNIKIICDVLIKSGISIDFEDEQGLRLTDIVIRVIAQNATIGLKRLNVLLQLGASTKGINEKLKKIAGSNFVELSGSKGSDDNENIKLLVGLIIICVGLYAFCPWLIKACRHKRQPRALGGAPKKQGAPQNKSSATPPKTKTKPAGVQTEADKRKKELEQNLKTLEDDLKRNKAAIDEYLSEIKKFEGNKVGANEEKNELIKQGGNSNLKKIEGLDNKIAGFNNKIERLNTRINSLYKAYDEIKRKIQEIEGQLRGEPLGGPAQPAQEGPLTTSGNSSAGAAGTSGNLSPGGAEEEASGGLNPGGAEEESGGGLSPSHIVVEGSGDSSEGGAGSAGAGGDSSEGGAVVDASGDQTKMKSDNLGDLRLILNQIVQRRKLTDGSESQSVHGQLNEFQQLILRLSPTKTDLDEFKQQLIKHQPMLIEYFEIYLEEKKRDIEHSVTFTMLAKAWVHFRQDELALRIIMQGVDTSEGLSKMSLEQLQDTLVSGGYVELGQHHIGGMLKYCFELAKSDDQDTFKSALNAWSVLVAHGNWNPIWLKAKDLIYALNEHLMLNPDHAHASGKSLQDLWRLDQLISQLFLIDGLSMDALEQLHRRAWNLDGPMQPAVFFTEEVVVSDLHQYVFQIIKYCKDHAGAPIAIKLNDAMTHILRQNSEAYLNYVNQGTSQQDVEIERELDLKVGEIVSDKDPMAFVAEQRPTDQQELLTTLFTVPDGVDPATEGWTSFNNMQSEFLRYIQG